MLLKKYLLLLALPLLFISCTSTEESSEKVSQPDKTTVEKIKKEDIPKKITILFITQPHCPSCDVLEKTMKLEKPARLINRYFTFKKVYLGEKLPEGLIPPNGTPTIYFLGYRDVALLEPMVGEKNEEAVVEFLKDALLEFKTLYGVDLEKVKENHES